MTTPGLLGRSILASVLVAAVAVVATALLTLNVTRGSLAREQVRVANVDNAIIERLVDYGRAHPDWADVDDLLEELASQGRQVLLTDLDGNPVAASVEEVDNTSDPSAVLEPLAAVLTAATRTLPESTRDLSLPSILLESRAQGAALRPDREGYPTVTSCASPSLAAWVEEDSDMPTSFVPDCSALLPAQETGGTGTARSLALLNNAVAKDEHRCLERRGVGALLVRLDPVEGAGSPSLLTVYVPATPGVSVGRVRAAWHDCATSVLTRRLGPVVAPSALLYLSETRPASTSVMDRVGNVRISLALGAVLLAVVGASLFASRRVLRPVRVLIAATRQMADGDLSTRVRVSGRDEVADLSRSFNDMAQALADAGAQRQRMVGDIAHELRTPLSNIRGYLEAGHDGVLQRDDAWTASLLEEAALLQHVIDDLQVLAQADAGQLVVRADAGDVVSTVDVALQAMRAEADGSGVRLERTGTDVAIAVHDRMRVRQVVANLVSNAVRHSTTGATVTVDVRAGETVRIEVRDQGEGIAEQHLPHVFERFYRVDRSRSRDTGGSGLGLAVVEQIVRAHHGTVSVRNSPDGGASFIVELPTSPTESSPAP